MDNLMTDLVERIKRLNLSRQAALMEYLDVIESETVTASEASRILQVDRQTIIRMIKRGELPATKDRRNWRIPRKAVEQEVSNRLDRKGFLII